MFDKIAYSTVFFRGMLLKQFFKGGGNKFGNKRREMPSEGRSQPKAIPHLTQKPRIA